MRIFQIKILKIQVHLHFTGTLSPHHSDQSSDNQTPLGQRPRPSASQPQASTAHRRPGVEFPTSSFPAKPAATSTSLRPTCRLKDLNSRFTHHTHAHRPGTSKGPGRGRARAREKRSRRSTVRPSPARHPPAGREPGGGGAGAPSSPKTSLKSRSSWAPQFAVVIGVAQGAAAPPHAAAATAATAPQRRFMPGRAGQEVAAPRQTFRAGTTTPSVPFRTQELATRRTLPGATATASLWCLSRHSGRSQHSPPRKHHRRHRRRRRRRRAPEPCRAPDPAPYSAPI